MSSGAGVGDESGIRPGRGSSGDRAHYPWVTRLLLSLHDRGELPNVARLEVEPRYGFVGRIVYRDGGIRMFIGRGLEGLNTTAAARVAGDKGWTRHFLQSLGFRCPVGEKFVLEAFADGLDRRLGRRFSGYLLAADAPAYVESTLEYPVYIKPARGTHGAGVYRCHGPDDVASAVAEYRDAGLEAFVVEQAVALPDFRVVVLDDDVLCCYERVPLSVVGDGRSSIRDLLIAARSSYLGAGRPEHVDIDDVRLTRNLARAGLDLDHVLAAGLEQQLLEVSNLSAGGRAVDRLADLHPHWRALCVEVTRQLGLHLCGVDLACGDIGDPRADYVIFEVNSSPGLDNFAAEGDAELASVRDVYRRVFDRPPDRSAAAGPVSGGGVEHVATQEGVDTLPVQL